MVTVNDLRKQFLDYFEGKGHKIVSSSSLLPKDDPTLLFTTAGMVQFKPHFAGTIDLEYTRAATVQKCLRTSDLENVGKTKRHCTFFEMLGNFSFGDYFKEEAIEFAWEFSTKTIGFTEDQIWISIYQDDDEAFEIWNKKIGVPAEKIIRLGKEDNFWGPAGDTGACGPCSELYFDRGKEFGCGSPDCKPGCECERFLEYWNLVFNQYNQDEHGNLQPLPRTGIDTGMGLERLATLLQDVDSVYDTNELKQIISFIEKETGKQYEGKNTDAFRVLADHSRALTFAMSDGVYPSNEGRGYVLRRILRRALRYTRQLGVHEPLLYKVVDEVIQLMGGFYPAIKESGKTIRELIKSEEIRFLDTLDNGMNKFEEIIKNTKNNKQSSISGSDAFLLYDTFGFPFEMTVEIAEEHGVSVDKQGFETEMTKQKKRGKQSWKSNDSDKTLEELSAKCGQTEFIGYKSLSNEAKIIALHDGSEFKDSLQAGPEAEAFIVLDQTVFYGESGGQVGDKGTISNTNGFKFEVADTKKSNGTIIHIGSIVNGSIKKGDTVTVAFDNIERNLTKANHTATHLLQAALRQTLGTHVKQAGSYVDPQRLRFDFSHFNALNDEELKQVEHQVNMKIWENLPVTTEYMELDDAIKAGAMAEFGEKYDSTVRVVKAGDYSMELCGGTHVDNTGKIGLFKILKESSPGAGLRRIEGITLKGILERYNSFNAIVNDLTAIVNVAEHDLVKKVSDLVEKNKSLEKQVQSAKKESMSGDISSIIDKALEINGIRIISHVFKNVKANELRDLSDMIRSKVHDSVVCLGSDADKKALLLFAATSRAVEKGADAGKLVKEVANIVQGGGGGRKDMAQAGGSKPEHLDKAIQEAVSAAKAMLG